MSTYTPEPEVSVAAAGTPGSPQRSAARRGWRIVPTLAVEPADTPATQARVRAELAGGADGVRLDLPGTASPGDVQRLFSGLDLSDRLLSFAWGSPGLAAVVLDALDARSAPTAIHLGLDPASRLAASGSLLGGTERRFAAGAEVAVVAAASGVPIRTFTFDDPVWHHASVALGIQLASGVAAVRAMEAEGLELADAFGAIAFRNTLPTRFLYGIATLRAGQALWRRVGQLCGVETTAPQTDVTSAPRRTCARSRLPKARAISRRSRAERSRSVRTSFRSSVLA